MRIDENYGTVALGVEDDITGAIVPFKVDPVTGRLLVVINIETQLEVDASTKIDQNYEGVLMVVTDDVAANIKPLKVCPIHGGILVDII